VNIPLPDDVWVQLAPDEAPAQRPHWLPTPSPPSATPAELAEANNPPERVPGRLWEWRRRGEVWQGRVSYRRPHVGWISHRDRVTAARTLDTYGYLWPDSEGSTRAPVAAVFTARADERLTNAGPR
jgi:hypothetical protein